MAAPNLQKMFGGVVPGGVIVVTPGTPIKVTSNLALASGNQKSRQSPDCSLHSQLSTDRFLPRRYAFGRDIRELR